MSEQTNIGIIGCGNISKAYFNGGKAASNLNVVACADLNMAAAEAKAEEYGCKAMTVDALLADSSIELVVNLTIPKAHVEVGLKIVEAGKHAYSEKPFAVTVEEAQPLIEAARKQGVRLGCAPDTFLGGGHQTARKVLDEGTIGRPLGGIVNFQCPGHERWHPNPAFYYDEGGGPLFDMGPYYLHGLVNLLGPIAAVTGMSGKSFDKRIATSEGAKGQEIEVICETLYMGTLRFHCGALVTLIMSFDTQGSSIPMFEIFGEKGTLSVPNPNTFGGQVKSNLPASEEKVVEHELAFPENARMIGVVDMVQAIRENRPHRVSDELALHALEVMQAIETSSKSGQHVAIKTKPSRPAPFPLGLDAWHVD